MNSKKINQLATELTPSLSDLTIIGDPSTGISKKITLSQMASLFTGTVEEYANLAAFPLVGVADTIYIALDTNIIYRWNTGTNAYVELSPNIVTSLVFNDANGFDGTISLVGSTATLTITTALTTGSVGFIGASGALLQDNANFFWDDTNNRLGIGTNAPTTAIDVFGSGIIGRLNGTSTNNSFLGFASAGTNKWSIGNVQSDHRFRIYSEANTAELVSVLQTGEVGIGIANPLTKLHIFGGASALIANLDANTSVAKSISFRSGNSSRINLEVSGTESGSNAGMNFFLRTYTDVGSLLETPFQIIRSTGITTIKELALTNVLSVANGGTGITSLTTGRIPFGNGTSAFGSSANLNWDNTNSRLGIGISTPISRIHLVEVGGPSVVPTMTISQDGDLGLDWVAGALNFYSYDSSSNSKGGIGHIRVAAETAYNTGYTPSYMAFYTHSNIANNNTTLGAATEKVRITAAGHLLISNFTDLAFLPAWDSGVTRIGKGGVLFSYRDNSENFMISQNYYINSSGNDSRIDAGNAANIYMASGAMYFRTCGNGTAGSTISWNNPMVMTSGGRVIVNSTTDRAYTFQVNGDVNSYACEIRQVNNNGNYDLLTLTHEATSGNRRMVIFNSGGYGTVGTIISTNTTTTYNTTSDYRLKEDLKDFDALNIMSKIKFYDFKWKTDDSRAMGVIAHELQSIVPYAVYGEKDGIDKDDKPSYQGVDYSKLVAIQGKAIQQLEARIKQLESK